jgi:hypothetical protein
LLEYQELEKVLGKRQIGRNTHSSAKTKVGGGGGHASQLAKDLRAGLLKKMGTIIAAFHEWDTDHSQTISYDEFKKTMASIGVSVTAEVEQLWKAFDADGSGEIVYHELKAALDPYGTANAPSAKVRCLR